jgi:FixJ family two-component response regulator
LEYITCIDTYLLEEIGVELDDRLGRNNHSLRRRHDPKGHAQYAGANMVYVIEDDSRVREALEDLLAAFGIACAAFRTAADYLAFVRPDVPSCLLLDIELPDTNGLDFQRELALTRHPPIIFITGHGDIPSSVRAIKEGAIDFLSKPVGSVELLAALNRAFVQDKQAKSKWQELETLRKRFSTLTSRESDVLPLIVAGHSNKQAAVVLGISEITLQIHRSRVMRKMGAQSVPDLVRIAEKLQLTKSQTDK